jgi:hypothetical protein
MRPKRPCEIVLADPCPTNDRSFDPVERCAGGIGWVMSQRMIVLGGGTSLIA